MAYLRKGNHCNKHLQSSFSRNGEINFNFSVIEEYVFPNTYDNEYKYEYVTMRELYYIQTLHPQYNICKEIRGGVLGRPKSEQERISIGNRKRGTKHTPEAIAKIKAARALQVFTPEHKEKIRIAAIKREPIKRFAPETDEQGAYRGSQIQNYYRQNSDKIFDVFTKDKVTFIGTFSILSDATKATGIQKKSISQALNRNKSGICNGYYFKYKEVTGG